ncbi:MAG: hypothetical protein PWP65_371 [Clostridia bacterium]|nr:hypothetical protein [Clostridia bacterium]
MLAATPRHAVSRPDVAPGYLPDWRKELQKARNFKLLIIGMVLAGFILGLLVTMQAARLIVQGYAVAQLKREISGLERENQRLHLEIARLKSPERIAAQASRLGLVRPKSDQICFLPATSPEPAKEVTETPPVAPAEVHEDNVKGGRQVLADLGGALKHLFPGKTAEAVVLP